MVHSQGYTLLSGGKLFISGRFLDSLIKRDGNFIPTAEIDKLWKFYKNQAASFVRNGRKTDASNKSDAIAAGIFHFTSFAQAQQVTTTDEKQFLHAPTDTFDIIGVQGDPVISPLREPTGKLFLKMEQIRFPTVSDTFEGVNGQVQFNLVVDPRVVGSGKRFTFRILVHNLTGNDRTETNKSFEISQTRQTSRQSYLVPIPQGAERIRVELQAFTDNGFPASNVFNEQHVKEGVIPPPPSPLPITKDCECCKGTKFHKMSTVRIGEACPTCQPFCSDAPAPTTGLGHFDQLVMGALILGAVLPLGGKKK